MAGDATSSDYKELFAHIDKNADKYIKNLEEAVAIKSVSSWHDHHRDEVIRMMKWAGARLEALGTKVEYVDVGMQPSDNGGEIPLPPVILGTLGDDPDKKTVLIYGHLDVQPAKKEDGWDTEPFVLTRKDDVLFGRGATDDKGPVLGWIHALEAMQELGMKVPVNIRFCLEGMEESGSEGLDELLHSRKDTDFIKKVDYVCISDNYWLGKNKPCLTYGLRGCCYFSVEVECAKRDFHSGVFGGSVHEAMADLIAVMNTLVDKDRKILIDGLMDDVAPITEKERLMYKDIDFDVNNYRDNDIGANEIIDQDDKTKVLMARWRFPSLSMHGIEGAFSDPGAKTVIPSKVIGKFSIRIVPNQTAEKVEQCVVDYMNKQWSQMGSPNNFKVSPHHSGRYWMADPDCPNFLAGKRATKAAYGIDPDLTRDGCSIPITLTLEEVTGKDVLLLPVGACDDGAHSQNEKINIRNYIQGTKMLGAYLNELSLL